MACTSTHLCLFTCFFLCKQQLNVLWVRNKFWENAEHINSPIDLLVLVQHLLVPIIIEVIDDCFVASFAEHCAFLRMSMHQPIARCATHKSTQKRRSSARTFDQIVIIGFHQVRQPFIAEHLKWTVLECARRVQIMLLIAYLINSWLCCFIWFACGFFRLNIIDVWTHESAVK